jgi:hypothetical protein
VERLPGIAGLFLGGIDALILGPSAQAPLARNFDIDQSSFLMAL